MNSKVIVIGLDGATFDLIEPWVKEGKLPNIGRLMREGSYGLLKSIHPPMSLPAWASFFTGKNPGKHGIFGCIRKDEKENFSFYDSTYIRTQTLWQVLNLEGKKSAFLFVPATYPPEFVNGVMISVLRGSQGIDSEFTYPPEFKEQLIKKYGAEFFLEPQPKGITQREFIRRTIKMIEVWTEIGRDIFRSGNLDFMLFVYGQTDRIQHYFWQYMDTNHPNYNPQEDPEIRNAIFYVYSKIDQSIGLFLDEFPGTNFILLSDHGASPYSVQVYINNLLKKLGVLSYKKTPILIALFRKVFLAIMGIMPRETIYKIKAHLPKFIGDKLFSAGVNPMSLDIDWEKTSMYSIDIFGNLFFNKKNKNYNRDEILKKVIDGLRDLKDPETNLNIIKQIYKKNEIYNGPFAIEAPEIVFTMKDNKYYVKPEYKANKTAIFSRKIKYAGLGLGANFEHTVAHNSDAILIAWGPLIKSEVKIENAGIIDLFPTILKILNICIPKDIDGKALDDILIKELIL